MESPSPSSLEAYYEDFRPDPRYLTKSYALLLFSSVILLILCYPFAYIVVDVILKNRLPAQLNSVTITFLFALGFDVVYSLIVALFIKLQFNAYHYHITKTEIQVNQGVILKKQIIIPMRTITNIDVSIGPVERLFGLATINIQTAGAVSFVAEGRLVGLLLPSAEYLRDYFKVRLQRQHGDDGTGTSTAVSAEEDVERVLTELRAIKNVLIDIRDKKA